MKATSITCCKSPAPGTQRTQAANMMSLKVLSLLLVSLTFVVMEENGTRENTMNSRFLQRRYSEGTLASDYSRTLDSMLKKNFVEWLLNRRENKIETDLSKREDKSSSLGTKNQDMEAESQEAKDFIICILQNMGKQSLALPKGSDAWKDVLRQENLTWLISADLCRPTPQ
ncbi:gastric inhibitory polypeptide isoform X2 [Rhineura floridana]|uniref:gastric inhibitory polypeptide isoform X2 n=1 Tax=Rhineura floridana TaxID=261503 RepID=UPI002AC88960|nr:gastric inhibitory polypeptide isoform X2 [Rhineura floridana]